MLLIKFITVAAFAILGIEVFVGKVLSCKMNLFVDIFELLFGIFHLFTGKAGLAFCICKSSIKICSGVISMFLYIGNSLSHLFQIRQFYFLSIGFALLCFDTGL